MNPSHIPVELLRIALGVCLAAYAAFSAISVWAAFAWRRSRRPLDPAWTPGVTILKPVSGLESPHAYSNFVTFCTQDYPLDRIHLVFGCEDINDAAVPNVRKLQAEYPQVNIELVTGAAGSLQGPNRKVCNLLSMLPKAKFDLLVLCDSDMRVEQDYLRRIVAPFQQVDPCDQNATTKLRAVGMVTCPYRGCRAESLPAILELLGIGAEFTPGALVSRATEGVGFAFGSTIAIHRQLLAEIGGFESIVSELADDFRLGERTRAAGYEVVLSDYVVDDVLGAESFVGMWNRRLRWARTVRSCRPKGYAGLFLTNGTCLGILFWSAMGFNAAGAVVMAGVLAVRFAATSVIAAACTADRNVMRYLPLLPISDLLSFCLYIASYCGNRIIWRGITFKLLPGGKMERVTE